jgi:hypothetical protein
MKEEDSRLGVTFKGIKKKRKRSEVTEDDPQTA